MISLTDSRAETTFALLVIVPLCCFLLMGARRTRRKSAGVALLLAAVLTLLAWFIVEKWWRPFPDPLPLRLCLAVAVCIALFVGVWVYRGRRVVTAVLCACTILGTWGLINVQYQQFATIQSLAPQPVSSHMDLATFQAQASAPQQGERSVGALVTLPLPGYPSSEGGSEFPARDAVAYVPPAYWEHPEIQLPVVVLLAGNPGEPMDWFRDGQGEDTAEQYQTQHGGVAPIIVSVDGTGSWAGNPICVDGPEFKVQTYLEKDVPRRIKELFRVNPDTRSWTIGGLSYGGTCSLQVVTRSPQVYGAFLNFSGQAEPTVGDHETTVAQFFGGSEEKFQAVNPEHLLRAAAGKDTYAGITGRFIAGESDPESVAALRHLHELAGAAGIESTMETVPGGHSFQVWRRALAETLPWAAEHGGLGAQVATALGSTTATDSAARATATPSTSSQALPAIQHSH